MEKAAGRAARASIPCRDQEHCIRIAGVAYGACSESTTGVRQPWGNGNRWRTVQKGFPVLAARWLSSPGGHASAGSSTRKVRQIRPVGCEFQFNAQSVSNSISHPTGHLSRWHGRFRQEELALSPAESGSLDIVKPEGLCAGGIRSNRLHRRPLFRCPSRTSRRSRLLQSCQSTSSGSC